MPQGGSAGPNMIDLANGQPAPSEAATRRRAAACPRRRRAGRDRVSRRAASRNSSYQRETQGRPRRFASAPPRAHTGHPILATCEARERAPRVPIGQASVPGPIRRGRLRAGARPPARGAFAAQVLNRKCEEHFGTLVGQLGWRGRKAAQRVKRHGPARPRGSQGRAGGRAHLWPPRRRRGQTDRLGQDLSLIHISEPTRPY